MCHVIIKYKSIAIGWLCGCVLIQQQSHYVLRKVITCWIDNAGAGRAGSISGEKGKVTIWVGALLQVEIRGWGLVEGF